MNIPGRGGGYMDTLKVMVVDDEARMRKLVRDFLVRNDFDVVEAADGQEAVDKFYEQKDIALIILDVMMPKSRKWTAGRLSVRSGKSVKSRSLC